MKHYKMYRMKNSLRFPLLMVTGLLITSVSCTIPGYKPNISVDARIICEVTETDTLFGLGFYAYTNDQFSSVSVTYAGAQSSFYTLQPYNGDISDFSYETPVEKMSHKPPPSGNYLFDATYVGNNFYSTSDFLSPLYVLPPKITRSEYDPAMDQVVVSWGGIVNGDIIIFRLYDLQRNLLFSSQAVDKSVIIYTFGAKTPGWIGDAVPQSGQQYILETILYLFEPTGGGALNTQADGRIDKIITWGTPASGAS